MASQRAQLRSRCSALQKPVMEVRGGRAEMLATTPTRPIPLTILSGFLGSGKTTLLQHLLQNTEGVRVGVVVNDLADVNVDAKLVQRGAGQFGDGLPEDMIELSNGCACCSAGDDLFGALAELVAGAEVRGSRYDHLIFEASGVAEPKLLRAKFQEAASSQMGLMRYVQLENMVTVVDAGAFLDQYNSTDRVSARQDLGGEPTPLDFKQLSVVQLLVEQVETADVLVLNKLDRVDASGRAYLEEALGQLNGFSTLVPTMYGKVSPSDVLVAEREDGVAASNEVMDHQSAVDMATWLQQRQPEEGAQDKQEHSHSHDSHSHDCNDPDCTDPSHAHSHSHDSHSHSHDCHDPGCTDPSHDHSHDDRQETTVAKRFGIRSFVYAARRPFMRARFDALVGELPFGKEPAAVGKEPAAVTGGPFQGVLRSKGFVWLADDNRTAFYWSQAGPQLDLNPMGRWWAAVPRASWPKGSEAQIEADWEGQWGDRRQELVFIGPDLPEAAIRAALDECLATAAELADVAPSPKEGVI